MVVNIDKFPFDPIAQKMMRRVSPIYGRSYLAKWLYHVMGMEIAEAWQLVEEMRAQAFVDTATWGIPYWEYRYTIQPDETLPLEERRTRIRKKLRRRYPLNPDRLEYIIHEIYETKIRITENVAPYTFALEVVDENYFCFNEIVKEIKRVKPSHLVLLMLLQFYQPIKLRHSAQCVQNMDSKHCIWNQGMAQSTRWDSTYCFDKTIRFNGLYGADYRERQRHTVELWYSVEAVQRNLVPINIFDGRFDLDGSHTWSGMAMTRLPIHKSISSGTVTGSNHKAVRLRNTIVATNSPDVYLLNPISQSSGNRQYVASPQHVRPKQISAARQSERVMHRQGPELEGAAMQDQVSTKNINIEHCVVATNQAVATYNSDYRTANLADGSFCMDGTHAFDGAIQQNYARAAHCCSITRILKNGVGRVELT